MNYTISSFDLSAFEAYRVSSHPDWDSLKEVYCACFEQHVYVEVDEVSHKSDGWFIGSLKILETCQYDPRDARQGRGETIYFRLPYESEIVEAFITACRPKLLLSGI